STRFNRDRKTRPLNSCRRCSEQIKKGWSPIPMFSHREPPFCVVAKTGLLFLCSSLLRWRSGFLGRCSLLRRCGFLGRCSLLRRCGFLCSCHNSCFSFHKICPIYKMMWLPASCTQGETTYNILLLYMYSGFSCQLFFHHNCRKPATLLSISLK